MQMMTPLIRHLRTDPTLLIHKGLFRHDLHPYLGRDLETLPARVVVAEQQLERLQQVLHRHEHAGGLGFLVGGLGADGGADLIRAHGVQGDVLFGQDLAEGADEADDGAFMCGIV